MKKFGLSKVLLVILSCLLFSSQSFAVEKPYTQRNDQAIADHVRKGIEVKASMEVQIRRIQKLFVKDSSNQQIFDKLQSLKQMYRQKTGELKRP